MKKTITVFIFVVCLFAGLAASPASAQRAGDAGSSSRTDSTGGGQTKEVVVGALRTYNHPSGWFSMSVPNNWKIEDKGGDEEAIVMVTDPTENAVMVLRVWNTTSRMNEEDLTNYLQTFLDDRMGNFKNFARGKAKTQNDGSVGVSFRYDSELAGRDYPMIGNSFIEQRGRRAALTSIIIPKEQYDRKLSQLSEFINSLSLN